MCTLEYAPRKAFSRSVRRMHVTISVPAAVAVGESCMAAASRTTLRLPAALPTAAATSAARWSSVPVPSALIWNSRGTTLQAAGGPLAAAGVAAGWPSALKDRLAPPLLSTAVHERSTRLNRIESAWPGTVLGGTENAPDSRPVNRR